MLYIDSYFSSPDLYNDLTKQKINCCSAVRRNCKGMSDFKSKTLKLKWGDSRVRTSGDMTAVIWKDKHNVHMLTNIHYPPAEGNFCDESGNAPKPAIVKDYNRHMGYINNWQSGEQLLYQSRTSKWTKKLSVNLLDHTILNSHILLQSYGSKLLHREFRLTLVRNVVELAVPQPRPLQTVGRLSALATRIGRLEEWVACTGLLNWNEDGLCSVSWPYKEETPNSDKVWKV